MGWWTGILSPFARRLRTVRYVVEASTFGFLLLALATVVVATLSMQTPDGMENLEGQLSNVIGMSPGAFGLVGGGLLALDLRPPFATWQRRHEHAHVRHLLATYYAGVDRTGRR